MAVVVLPSVMNGVIQKHFVIGRSTMDGLRGLRYTERITMARTLPVTVNG